MENVKRIYVEKKEAYAVKAKELEGDLKSYLGIHGVEKVRVFIRYDVENLEDEVFEKYSVVLACGFCACRLLCERPEGF